MFESIFESDNMIIVPQRNAPVTGVLAAARQRANHATDQPSSVDIERMLRADRVRFTYWRAITASLAAALSEAAP